MLQIQMFGHFRMYDGERMLDEASFRSEMVLKLLTYIICHRKRPLSVRELTQILWDGSQSRNPAGALKNLVYRLRTILRSVWPETEFILTGRASYQWNRQVELAVDVEYFQQLCLAARRETGKEKAEFQRKAAAGYRGRFLEGIRDQGWVTKRSACLHSLYLEMVRDLAAYLNENGQFRELEEMARKAIDMEPLDEGLYGWLIRALIGEGREKSAAEEYHRISGLLYRTSASVPADSLQELWRQLAASQKEDMDSFSVIQAGLREKPHAPGVFFCGYETFRDIYELEIRREKRAGRPVLLVLLALHPAEETETETLRAEMDRLKNVLLASLRRGDVVAQYDTSRFLVMLSGCRYEDGRKVMERVEYEFAQSSGNAAGKLCCSMEML